MLKFLTGLALALSLAIVASSNGIAADEQQDIVGVLAASKDHTILVSAVKEAGLVETLKGKGPFTVFAPTDAAFKKLGAETIAKVMGDKELLKKILLAHVVVGKACTAKDAAEMDGKEVNGFKIASKDGVKIGPATVTKADIKASNGVVHVIDTVLVPAS